VTSLSWLPGKAELVTSCYGGLQFVEVGRAEWVRRLDWKGSILTAAPSPDGRFIATGNQDATVHVWVTRTGKDLQMNGYPRKVRELAWHGDGPLLATGGSDVITLWSFGGRGPAGKPPEELKGHEQRVCGLAFAGRRLVSVAEDGTLRVWERKQSWRCTRVETADMPLVGLGVSPDGRWAAAAGDGGQLAVWPLEDAGG
jgi:WD40 repeat protein